MKKEIDQILDQAKKEIPQCQDFKSLEELRIKYSGRKSQLSSLLSKIGDLPVEERPEYGKLLNKAKNTIKNLLAEKSEFLQKEKQRQEKKKIELDISLPGRIQPVGAIHPLNQIWEEIEDIFISMGYEIAEGPEIETEYNNFDALNTPEGHPARNLKDTFYLKKHKMLLRTHTSPVQIRIMKKYKPPLYIISPGRCYRNDKVDASHLPVFHQFEALVVDENITFPDLKGSLDSFVKQLFGKNIISRFRPHYFPFTEPSAEIDIMCIKCKGKGCGLCDNSGWLEMGGAGMVDPEVFKNVGYDPEKYTGFAFGLGIDRIAMLRYGITDIRILFKNDLRILKQFV